MAWVPSSISLFAKPFILIDLSFACWPYVVGLEILDLLCIVLDIGLNMILPWKSWTFCTSCLTSVLIWVWCCLEYYGPFLCPAWCHLCCPGNHGPLCCTDVDLKVRYILEILVLPWKSWTSVSHAWCWFWGLCIAVGRKINPVRMECELLNDLCPNPNLNNQPHTTHDDAFSKESRLPGWPLHPNTESRC